MYGPRYIWPFYVKNGLISCVFNLKCSGIYFQRCGTLTLPAGCVWKFKPECLSSGPPYHLNWKYFSRYQLNSWNGMEYSLYSSTSMSCGWCPTVQVPHSLLCQVAWLLQRPASFILLELAYRTHQTETTFKILHPPEWSTKYSWFIFFLLVWQ